MEASQKRRQRQGHIAELSEGTGRNLATKTMLVHAAQADHLGFGNTDLKSIDLLRAAMHALHRAVGSVPVALVRHAKYPIMVIP